MNPLHELFPPAVRRYVYAVIALLALVFAAWQAAGGDWLEFAAGLLAMLVNMMAVSNTPTPETTTAYVPAHRADEGYEDDELEADRW